MTRSMRSLTKMWLFQMPDFSKELEVILFSNIKLAKKSNIPYYTHMSAENKISV